MVAEKFVVKYGKDKYISSSLWFRSLYAHNAIREAEKKASSQSRASGEMEDGGGKSAETPFLEPRRSGSTSAVQTLANIVVSIVGTGVLGLPFAFRIAGWLAGTLGVVIAGAATYYCMLLLVSSFLLLSSALPCVCHGIIA